MWGFEESWLTSVAAIFLCTDDPGCQMMKSWHNSISPFQSGRSKWWKICSPACCERVVHSKAGVCKQTAHCRPCTALAPPLTMWTHQRLSGSNVDAVCGLTELCREGLARARPTLNAACVPTLNSSLPWFLLCCCLWAAFQRFHLCLPTAEDPPPTIGHVPELLKARKSEGRVSEKCAEMKNMEGGDLHLADEDKLLKCEVRKKWPAHFIFENRRDLHIPPSSQKIIGPEPSQNPVLRSCWTPGVGFSRWTSRGKMEAGRGGRGRQSLHGHPVRSLPEEFVGGSERVGQLLGIPQHLTGPATPPP